MPDCKRGASRSPTGLTRNRRAADDASLHEALKEAFVAAGQFSAESRIASLSPFGKGNINATYLVTPARAGDPPFILQKLNTKVFPNPEIVMDNMRICTDHMTRRMETYSATKGRRWETVRILSSRDGRDLWNDPHGSSWRALTLIDGVSCHDTVQHQGHAFEVGYALGTFHHLVSEIPVERLADTLPGFHITPLYLRHYEEICSQCPTDGSAEARYCRRFIEKRRELATLLEDAKTRGCLIPRTIHGDPKVNNILLDEGNGSAVGIVDLDTVKPGLVQYDIGDCLRSACNPLGEETEEWEKVCFDPDVGRAVLTGYLSSARDFLTAGDFDYLYDAARLIAFELGLRFFTDYLEGDIYFKTDRSGHNLLRALVQFRLAEDIESQESRIRALIRDLQ